MRFCNPGWERTPSTTNPSESSSKVSQSFKPEEHEFTLIKNTIASTRTTNYQRKFVLWNKEKKTQEHLKQKNAHIKKHFIMKKKRRTSPIPAPRIQNISRMIELTGKQCTCFPYFKYIVVCGKVITVSEIQFFFNTFDYQW